MLSLILINIFLHIPMEDIDCGVVIQKTHANVTTELDKNLSRLLSEIVCLENKFH